MSDRKFRDMDKAERKYCLDMADRLPQIEEWMATLPKPMLRNLNHPTTVMRKYLATGAEAAVTRLKKKVTKKESLATLSATITALQEEAVSRQHYIAEVESGKHENALRSAKMAARIRALEAVVVKYEPEHALLADPFWLDKESDAEAFAP
jgi:hypothetical protein